MIVLWSDEAIAKLQDTFDYYDSTAGRKVADKITNSIVDQTIKLEKNSRVEQAEELLKHRKKEIRYLVDGNYKIVYWLEENFVNIATIFDCRQNPVKLKNIKL